MPKIAPPNITVSLTTDHVRHWVFVRRQKNLTNVLRRRAEIITQNRKSLAVEEQAGPESRRYFRYSW